MNVISHGLLPVLFAATWLPRQTRAAFNGAAGLVMLGGMLPDLVDPHLSMAARLASWSHSVFAALGFGLVLAIAGFVLRRRLASCVVLFSGLAYVLHLACDMISGGIAPLHPASSALVATPWIRYAAWWWCDLACASAALVVLAITSRYFDRPAARPSA